MAEIRETLTLDVSAAIKSLERYEAHLLEINGSYERLQKAGAGLFTGAGNSLSSFVGDVRELDANMGKARKSVQSLERYYKFLENAQKKATDPNAVQRYAQELARVRVAMVALERTGVRAWDNIEKEAKQAEQQFNRTGKAAGAAGRQQPGAGQAVRPTPGAGVAGQLRGELAGLIGVTSAAAGVVLLTKEVLGAAASYERLNASFKTFLGSAEQAEEVLAKLTNFAGATPFSANQVNEAGKALLAFGEDADNLIPVLTRIGDISAATGKDFNELAVIYGKARTQGTLYAEDINQLTEAGIDIITEFANQMDVSTDEVKKLASEGRITFPELELAFFNLTTGAGDFAGLMEEQSRTLGGQWDQLLSRLQLIAQNIGRAITPAAKAVLSGLSVFLDIIVYMGEQAYIRVQEVYNGIVGLFDESLKVKIDYSISAPQSDFLKDSEKEAERQAKEAEKRLEEQENTRTELEKRAAEARAKAAAASRKKEAAARQRDSERLARQQEAEERQRQELQLALLADGVQKEITLENIRYTEQIEALQKYFAGRAELQGLIEQAEQQHRDKLTQIQADADEANQAELTAIIEQFEAEEALNEELRQARIDRDEQRLTDAQRAIEQELQIEAEGNRAKVLALQKQGARENEVRKLEQQLDNELKIKRLESELQFQRALLEIVDQGDTARITQIQNSIALIRQQIENEIAAIDLEGQNKVSLLSLLGIDPEDEGAALAALSEAANKVIGSLKGITDAKVREAEETVRAAESKVQAAEAALTKEEELAEEGFANDVSRRQRELEQAKKQQAEAVALQKKAAREQIALEGSLQAASLITSSANIFRSLTATIPAPIAIPLAIATIAAMIAAFAKAKADAFKATKLRHGGEGRITNDGVVMGPSHAAGGVPIEVEGGELIASDGKRLSVVNKEMTSEHFELLRAVNQNDRPAIVEHALSLAGYRAPTFEPPKSVSSGARIHRRATDRDNGNIVAGKEIAELLRQNNSLTKQIADGSGVMVTAFAGGRIEKKGNKTRVVRYE